MSVLFIDNCLACDKPVVFDLEPYENPEATLYWKSTYSEPDEYLRMVERKVFTNKGKSRVTIQIFKEYILGLYCGPDCGLKDYEEHRD